MLCSIHVVEVSPSQRAPAGYVQHCLFWHDTHSVDQGQRSAMAIYRATYPWNSTARFAMEVHNTYWVLRHGKSLANEKGIIVSTYDHGLPPYYGLHEAGKQQAVQAGKDLKAKVGAHNSDMLVLCSPLTRALETAVLASEQLGILTTGSNFQIVEELLERNFGELELKSDRNYQKVWDADAASLDSAPAGGGESVTQVSERIKSLFSTLEAADKGRTILLVSHGDTLSILWATVKGLPLGEHRSHGLKTGELRLLHSS